MHVTPGYIVPLSNIPTEGARQEAAGQAGQTKTLLDWTHDLQLWTLEPVALKNPAAETNP